MNEIHVSQHSEWFQYSSFLYMKGKSLDYIVVIIQHTFFNLMSHSKIPLRDIPQVFVVIGDKWGWSFLSFFLIVFLPVLQPYRVHSVCVLCVNIYGNIMDQVFAKETHIFHFFYMFTDLRSFYEKLVHYILMELQSSQQINIYFFYTKAQIKHNYQ